MVSKPHDKDTKSNSSCHSFGENDNLVEQAAEQVAILLWKTWLHKKNVEDKEDKVKASSKKPSTAV